MFDFSVHQAAGMVAVQGSIPVKDALVALQMRAFSSQISVSDLALRVIGGRIRYLAQGRTWLENEG
jgi:hypothetical protein